MTISNKETIEVKSTEVYVGKTKLLHKEVYVDGRRRASLEQQRNGHVLFRFDPCGAFSLQESRVWLLALLELSTHAEELVREK